MGMVERLRSTVATVGRAARSLLPGKPGEDPWADSAAEPVQQPARARTHTLAPGETLVQVADRYDVDVSRLAEHNGIEDPELVFAGQVFRIPGDD